VSDPSAIVSLSIRSQMPAAAMPMSSTKPGLIPVPNIDDPPRSQASRMRSRSAGLPRPLMKAAVLTTSTPASRMRTSSSVSGHMGL
jgi:hypothetical protein